MAVFQLDVFVDSMLGRSAGRAISRTAARSSVTDMYLEPTMLAATPTRESARNAAHSSVS
ncbi:hypothetical protein H0E84_15195 [Luteimonas sp. SJ-92]|uniref:Uncharacterized protein n=1 Tax=Luteimonas salinisoli TaxID=2752307 RepID=A0A853JFU7_9GAMM|nr:hypothetical protein [Luteimonas salinisoli]NZA27725.1 hypothetical protein [Luteimonas salinisoli]